MSKPASCSTRSIPPPFRWPMTPPRPPSARPQANLPSIRSRAERYKELLADKAVSQQDYDDAAAAVEQAQAEIEYWKAAVEAARINLGYTRVTAPISGRIGKSNVTDGALVTAYQPTSLATIQQLDPIYVDVTQSSAELLRLKRNLEAGRLSTDGENRRKVRLLLEDGTPYPLEGTLQFRDVTVDPTTGSFTLRIVCPESGTSAPAGHVRAGRGPGGDRGAGHPGSPARGEPQSQGGTHRPGRG